MQRPEILIILLFYSICATLFLLELILTDTISTMFLYILVYVNTWLFYCHSYADTSGAGKDVYEFVSSSNRTYLLI
jgi:hypothetical protein